MPWMSRPAAAVLVTLATLAPALATASQPPQRPALEARSAAVLDPRSGRLLYDLAADVPVPPASLAKMIVALLAAERLTPVEPVRISRAAARARADTLLWREGASFSVETLLHGMLMESSNGAAIALAERLAGSIAAFGPMADARAAALGATRSRFVDPSGLDAPGQYSTAHDLAVLAWAVLREPRLAAIVRTRAYPVSWPDGTTVVFHARNGFLRRYPGAIGVKNGFTSAAGNCVAAAAIRGGVVLVAVVMNDRLVYDDAARLMDLGFGLAPASPATGDPLRVEEGLPRRAVTGPHGVPAGVAAPDGRRQGPVVPVILIGGLTIAYTGVGARRLRRRVQLRRRLARQREATSVVPFPVGEEPRRVVAGG
jgi:D-alanyl-D-alanine carboxypeptidase (penicillin-binding protein 5/6)